MNQTEDQYRTDIVALVFGLSVGMALVGYIILCTCRREKKLVSSSAQREFKQLTTALLEALRSIDIETIESALKSYIDYGQANDDITLDKDLMKEANDAIESQRKTVADINQVHETLKKVLEDSIATKRASVVRESVKQYEEFSQDFSEKVDCDKRLLAEGKRLVAKDDAETYVTELREAVRKHNVNYIQESLPTYERLVLEYKDVLEVNKKVVHDAKHVLKEFESVVKHSDILRRDLEKTVMGNDMAHVEKVLKKYTDFLESCGFPVSRDQNLMNKANSLLLEKRSQMEALASEHTSAKGALKSALVANRLTQISISVKAYEQFVCDHRNVEPDNTLLGDAKKHLRDMQREQVALTKEHDGLRRKVEVAIENNNYTAIKTALQHYEEFSEKHKDRFNANSSLLTIARTIVSERENELQNVGKKHDDLKSKLVSATSSRRLVSMQEALSSYELFGKENATLVNIDQGLVRKTKEQVTKLQKDVNQARRDYAELYKALQKAILSRANTTILEALHRYETFARQHGENIDIDNEIIQQAKNIVKEMNEQVRSKIEKHNTLKHDLVEATKERNMSQMITCLANYEKFSKSNTKICDLALIRQTKDVIKNRENEIVQLKRKHSNLRQDLKTATGGRNRTQIAQKLEIYETFAEENSNVVKADVQLTADSKSLLEELDILAAKTMEDANKLKEELLKTMTSVNLDEMKSALSKYTDFVKANSTLISKDEGLTKQATDLVKMREQECFEVYKQRDRIVKKLETAIASRDDAAIASTLAEYQQYVREYFQDITLNNDLVERSQSKIKEIADMRSNAKCRDADLKEKVRRAMKTGNLGDMKSAVGAYKEFASTVSGVVDIDGSFTEEADREIKKREADIQKAKNGQLELRRELEAACASRDKGAIENILKKYENYVKSNAENIELETDIINQSKSLITEIEQKCNHAKEGLLLAKRKIAGAIKSFRLEDMKTALEAYLEFTRVNKEFVELDQLVVKQAQESIAKREEELKELSKEQTSLENQLRKFITDRNRTAIEEQLSLYAEFTRQHFNQIQPHKELLNSAKAIVDEIEQSERLAQKECSALEKNLEDALQSLKLEDMKNALTKYQDFMKIKSSVVDVDSTLVKKAEQAIKKREHEMENLKKKCIYLKKELEKALSSRIKPTIDEKLSKYNEFIQSSRGNFDIDQELVNRSKVVIEELKTEAKKINEDYNVLKEKLKEALKSQKVDELMSLITEYEKFISQEQTSYAIQVDHNLLKQSKDTLKKKQAELGKLLKEFEFLTSDLQKSNEAHDKEAIESALPRYETFVRENHQHIEIDNNLIKMSQNILQEMAVAQQQVIEEHKLLKEELRRARDALDEARIAAAVKKYEEFLQQHKGSVFADRNLLVDAKNAVIAMHKKVSLTNAVEERDLKHLNKAIGEVERRGIERLVKVELEAARKMKESLEHIEQLRQAILNLDRTTMMEIRDYSHPPKVVHEVMIATLLLLGDSESVTRDWGTCQKLCSSIRTHDYPGLLKRVRDHNFKFLSPEIAARGVDILKNHNKEEINSISHGAFNFYVWASGMCELCLSLTDEKPKPATGVRQKHILTKMMNEMTAALDVKSLSPTKSSYSSSQF